MFAIAKNTTAAQILKAQDKTGLILRAPMFTASQSLQATVQAEDGFCEFAFESALNEIRIPTITRTLSPEELEAYAIEYAESEAMSALSALSEPYPA